MIGLLAIALAEAAGLPSVEDDRLRLCVEQAAADSASAVAGADRWLAEARGPARAKPLQCLGQAYTALLRWQAAEDAFVAAADALGGDQPVRRAALLAQAGNAALAGGRAAGALARFDAALAIPASAGGEAARGLIQADRARALVALDRPGEAGAALTEAQRDAPDAAPVWLLSATLSRRAGDLAAAQRQIETAAGLDPADPEIGLEAGVVAMLAGRSAAARQSWQSVVRLAPDSAAAATAQGYLAEIGAAAQPEAAGR